MTKQKRQKMFAIDVMRSLLIGLDMLDLQDPDDVIGFGQMLNALGYTLYLSAKGLDDTTPRKEEMLIAQSYNNQMLRGLYDLIELEEDDVNKIIDGVHVCHVHAKSKRTGD